jgi:hypothetical protein
MFFIDELSNNKTYIYDMFMELAEASDQDQERGVPALLAFFLPHNQRHRLVLLRPAHERFLRSGMLLFLYFTLYS